MERTAELALRARLEGQPWVAGVDEVGRGPLAGPVVAAAVVLPDNPEVVARWLGVMRDSKTLRAARREALAKEIQEQARVGLGEASVAEIDALNIRNATFVAMRRSLAALPNPVQAVIVDGNARIPGLRVPQTAVVKGDARELSVACASIVAKVVRDALMARLGAEFPLYGWAQNAGYGTAQHLAALAEVGATPHHRTSFTPVAAVLQAARPRKVA